jgi:hypothetical protein
MLIDILDAVISATIKAIIRTAFTRIDITNPSSSSIMISVQGVSGHPGRQEKQKTLYPSL